MLTPDQIRAGRALLNWSTQELADRAGIGCRTIGRIERAETLCFERATLDRIEAAFHEAGIDFWFDGFGACVRRTG